VTELLLQSTLFWLAWCLYQRRTYTILLGAALLNPLIYQLDASSYWLLAVCAGVDTLTALLILRWGDVHQLYQVLILAMAVMVSFMCELDMGGSNLVYSDYATIVRSLTTLQLLGAGYGLLGLGTRDRPVAQHRP
jgi:hypothetical protein